MLGPAGCRQDRPPDPEAAARSILAECGEDWACVHERWRRDPRHWNLGLRAELGWKRRSEPAIVTTTRELPEPELARSPCAPRVGPVYFRTTISLAASGEFPLALFFWPTVREAERGHRAVAEATEAARGAEQALWNEIQRRPDLDQACVRFAGRRDRCESAS